MATCFEWVCESCDGMHSIPIKKESATPVAVMCDSTFDFEVMQVCDPDTGNPVFAVIGINCDEDVDPVVTLYNLDGTEYTGNTPVACGNRDWELFILCDPDTDLPVIVTLGFNPQTGEFVQNYYNADGTDYTGNPPILCARDFEYTHPFTFCLNDVEDITRIDVYENDNATTPVASVWQDALGNVIPTPDPADITVGSCQEDQIFSTTGHILDCGFEDVTININEEIEFNDAGAFSRLNGPTALIRKLREIIFEAQKVEKNETRNNIAVTPIILNTTANGAVAFNASGYTNGNVGNIFVDDAEVIGAWPAGVDILESIEYTRLIDCNCVPVEMVQRINNDGTSDLISLLDPALTDAITGEKVVIPLPLALSMAGPFPGPCIPESPQDLYLSVGYIQRCTPQNVNLSISQNATFSTDGGAGTHTITANSTIIDLLLDSIRDAQINQQSEENAGMAVTLFNITTVEGDTYTFEPNALQDSTATTIILDDTFVTAWPDDGDKIIEAIQYTALGNCVCDSIEMVQRVNDNSSSELIAILDPSTTDIITGEKVVIDYPLEYGVTGPFPGPCPDPIQVISIDDLCCNSNLAGNEPEVAQQRLAWLDASRIDLMTPDGGALGTAVDGDNIVQIDDVLGGGLNFVVPNNIAPGDDGNANGAHEGPILTENEINGLSVLHFDENNPNRLRLDTNTPQGSSFTLFYLYRADNNGVANQAIMSVGPNNGDGDAYHPQLGSWQLARDSNDPWFIFRIASDNTENEPIDILAVHSPATDSTVASTTWEQAIAPINEAYDGQLHLITATYDQISEELQIFFDGQLRYHGDMSPAPNTFGALAADYFRIFGNRAGDAYGTGDIAEIFFSNTILSDEEVAIINSYLVCKWDIDPSLAAGGTGDLELAPDGTYNTPTDFVRIRLATGETVYRNFQSGLEYSTVPLPGLAVCVPAGTDTITTNDTEHSEHLCDINATGDVVGITWHSITYNSFANVIQSRMVGYRIATPDTLLDPYTPLGTLQVCSEEVTIDSSDIESNILCDNNGPFIRHTIYDVNTGTVDNVFDTALDATTAYVTVGNVDTCFGDITDNEPLILCDNNGPFLRRYNYIDGVLDSIIDTELDGTTAYITVGAITICETTQIDRELICYQTTATGDTVLQAWARHDDDLVGVVANHIDTIGGIAYFTTTVPVAPLDITQAGFEFVLCSTIDYEQKILCDVQNDDTIIRFIRHYVYTDGTTTTQHFDTELDGNNPYIVTGTVTVCASTLDSTGFIQNLDGIGNFTPPAGTGNITVIVRRVGDTANPPTITDSNGTWDIFEGDSLNWAANDNGELTLGQISLSHADDYVTILYTVHS